MPFMLIFCPHVFAFKPTKADLTIYHRNIQTMTKFCMYIINCRSILIILQDLSATQRINIMAIIIPNCKQVTTTILLITLTLNNNIREKHHMIQCINENTNHPIVLAVIYIPSIIMNQLNISLASVSPSHLKHFSENGHQCKLTLLKGISRTS